MNRKVTCYRAVIYTILFYTVLAVCLLGLTDILKKDRVVAGAEKIAGETVEMDLDPGRKIQQVFIADGGYLRYLDIYVTSPESAGQFFRLMVYDETNEILYNEEIMLSETEEYPGYMRLPVGIETVAGRAYVWQLQSAGGVMRLGWQNTAETGMTNLGYYYSIEYDEITTYEAQNVLMRQVYTHSPSRMKMAVLLGGICGMAFIVCAALEYLGSVKRMLQKKLRMQHVVWMTLVPVFYAGMLYLAYQSLIADKFGFMPEDKLVYGLGIGIASVYFGYVFFARRRKVKMLPLKQLIEKREMDWLQAAAFAGVLWGCIDYMNAQYQFFQDCAYRVVLLWAGFLLLTMCPVKKICGFLNTGWLLLGGMAALAFYRCNIDIKDGQEEILDAILMRYNVMIGVMAFIVAAALIWQLCHKKLAVRAINPWYAGLCCVLFAFLIIFRNTRGWPIYLVVMFGLFYLFYLCWENRGRLMANFCNGVMLNFALAVLFCTARRPFRAWIFSRYNFVFHTATVTATYLTLILCVLTVRLWVKLKTGKRLVDLWGTLLLYGMAVSFLFLTLSRTGYLAAVVVIAVLLPFVTFFVYRESWRQFVGKAAVMAAAAFLCLPMTYCGIRLLPAVYNDPYIFEFEDSATAIHKDEAADSSKYMSVQRLFDVVEDKLLADASAAGQEYEEIMLCLKGQLEGGVYLMPGQPLVVSAGAAGLKEAGDFSNGRMDIFAAYIKEWNLNGHKIMGVPLSDGTLAVHAHNTYLQVIHDHGLVTGILFVIFGAVSCVLMFIYAVKKIKEDPYAVLPLAVFIGFAVAGLVEWLFHPCNHIGFSVMIVFAPLLCRIGGEKEYR